MATKDGCRAWGTTWILSLASFFLILLSHTLPALGDSIESAQQTEQAEYDNFLRARSLSYSDAVALGTLFEHAMELDASTAVAVVNDIKQGAVVTSTFTAFGDLKRWGWVQDTRDTPSYGDSLDAIFTSRKISLNDNEYIKWTQEEDVENDDDEEIDASFGEYFNSYNVPSGAITADNNYGPRYYNRCGPWVDLEHWSDVAFLQWQELCQNADKEVTGLEYVIHVNEANSDTKKIIRQVVGKSVYEDWSQLKDGKPFKRGTDQYRALLATPNGRGAAWMLIQHKPQFGLRTISQITIISFQKDGDWYLAMIQKIEPVTGT